MIHGFARIDFSEENILFETIIHQKTSSHLKLETGIAIVNDIVALPFRVDFKVLTFYVQEESFVFDRICKRHYRTKMIKKTCLKKFSCMCNFILEV